MEFTESYKQTGPCCFSPNARYIAVAVDYRLVIRDTISFKVVNNRFCLITRIMFPSFCFMIVWLRRKSERNACVLQATDFDDFFFSFLFCFSHFRNQLL